MEKPDPEGIQRPDSSLQPETMSNGSSNKAQLATEEDSALESTEHDLAELAISHSDSKELISDGNCGSVADVVSISVDEQLEVGHKRRETGCARCWTRTLQYRRIWAVVVVLLGVTLIISGMASNWAHDLLTPGIVIFILGSMVFCIDKIRKSRRKQQRHHKGPKISLLKSILTPRPDKRKRAKEGRKKKKQKDLLVESDSLGENAAVKAVPPSPKDH